METTTRRAIARIAAVTVLTSSMPAFTILRQPQRLQHLHLRMQPVPESPLYSPPFCVMIKTMQVGCHDFHATQTEEGSSCPIRSKPRKGLSLALPPVLAAVLAAAMKLYAVVLSPRRHCRVDTFCSTGLRGSLGRRGAQGQVRPVQL
ncbi:MAG: hypothetical protein FWF60_06460 [Oscillospiraceae bacterium]|nr:hypothetical protein [Oscillospiraceae bacterium]